jgi:hypothetical protein
MRIQLARAGTADNGQTLTKKDIQDLVSTFRETPATIGHKLADHMPAMGWVKSLHPSSDYASLDGDVDLIAPMRDAFAQGLYKKWSIGARRKPDGQLYLHHLAFLGAAPPAFKDLQVINMAEEDRKDIIAFEFTDEGANNMTLEELKKALDEANAKLKKAESSLTAKTKEFSDLEAKVAEMTKTEKKDEKAEFSDHPAWIAMQKEVDAARKAATKQKVDALKSVVAGKLPAAQVTLLAEFAEKIDSTDALEFSDAKPRSAVEVLQEIFSALPQIVEPGRYNFSDPKGASDDRDFDAIKLMGHV